jgi:hypothetical protein
MYEKNCDKKNLYFKKSFNLSLNLSHNTVPNNTMRKIATTLQIAVNGGIFLSKYTTKIPPQNKIFTKISVGVMCGGYDSKNFMA